MLIYVTEAYDIVHLLIWSRKYGIYCCHTKITLIILIYYWVWKPGHPPKAGCGEIWRDKMEKMVKCAPCKHDYESHNQAPQQYMEAIMVFGEKIVGLIGGSYWEEQ